MWKLLQILLVIAVPTLTVADKTAGFMKNFHEVYTAVESFSAVITSVIQTRCHSTTLCHGFIQDLTSCQNNCQNRLVLDVDDFSAIRPHAFFKSRPSDIQMLKLTSDIPDCIPKKIKLVPASFQHLPNVNTLELDCIQFSATTNPFKTLESVANVTISNMAFKKGVGRFVSDFPKLKKLAIMKVQITSITPSDFYHTQELQELHLQYNNVTVIRGNSFQDLHNLTKLTIIHNNVTKLRSNIFSKLAKYDTLALYENKIKTIQPAAFTDLSIHTLDLSLNKLENLPDGIFGSIRNMGYLVLQSNNMKTIGRNTFKGVGRIYLDLSFNKIQTIEPDAFLGLYLNSLDLHNNNLTVLDADSFNSLHVRDNVRLSNNQLVEIKDEAFRNLTARTVILECNKINQSNVANWGVDENLIREIAIIDLHCY